MIFLLMLLCFYSLFEKRTLQKLSMEKSSNSTHLDDWPEHVLFVL